MEDADSAHLLLGCAMAVSGNAAISLALNVQKWTHNRVAEAAVPVPQPSYLRHPLWWGGMLLLAIGELGNFVAYGFAPPLLIAPLGTVALVCNAALAPWLLGERMQRMHMLGIVVSVCGTVGLMLLAGRVQAGPPMTAAETRRALGQWPVAAYAAATVVLLGVLGRTSSETRSRVLFIEVGMLALYGGWTVVCTRGLSTMLAWSVRGALATWATYACAVGLAVTSVLQIRHLNAALAHFDAVRVIPAQFVLFSLSATAASAVVYRDLANMPPAGLLLCCACVATIFLGVWLMAQRPKPGVALDISTDALPLAFERVSVEERVPSSEMHRGTDAVPLVTAATLFDRPPSEASHCSRNSASPAFYLSDSILAASAIPSELLFQSLGVERLEIDRLIDLRWESYRSLDGPTGFSVR